MTDTPAPAKSAIMSFGSVGFNAWQVPVSLQEQGLLRGGEGVKQFYIDDLSAGLQPTAAIQPWDRAKANTYRNEGVIVHIPGKRIARLAYKLYNQTLSTTDISGHRAANLRVHSLMSSLGSSSGARFYAAIGKRLYRDISTSNPALEQADNNIAATDNFTAIAELNIGGTTYLATAGGSTDGVRGTTDPTVLVPVWTALVALSAGDYIGAMGYIAELKANYFLGKIGGVAGLFYVLDSETAPVTPHAVVDTASKDEVNPAATLRAYGPQYSREAYNGGVGPSNDWAPLEYATYIGAGPIKLTAGYMVGDGVNFATLTQGGGLLQGNQLACCNYGFDAIVPPNLIVSGVLVEISAKESNLDANAHVQKLTLIHGIDQSTTNAAELGYEYLNNTLSDEFTTAFATYSFFGSTFQRAADLTAAIVRDNSFGVAWTITIANTGRIVSADFTRLTVYGRNPGFPLTHAGAGGGGFGIGAFQLRPNRVGAVLPKGSDQTGVNVPREYVYWDLEFDSNGNRITATETRPYTGLAYIEAACPYQGGAAIAGGSSAGPGVVVKLVADDGQVRNLNFPALHGTAPVRVVKLEPRDDCLMALVANADGTDCQEWVYYDGNWNAFGVLQSKVAAISALPLAWAETTPNLTQNRLYNFWPSGTSTAVSYQFLPPDMLTDPNLVNTTEPVADGPLSVELVELDCGPEEGNKALLALQCQSRWLSYRLGDYGSVKVEVDVTGDRTLASPAVSATFDDGTNTAAFEDYNVGDTDGTPGKAYRSQVIRLTLDNPRNGSTHSPNALPVLEWLSVNGPLLRTFDLHFNPASQPVATPMSLFKRLKALADAKTVQKFEGDGVIMPAVIASVSLKLKQGTSSLQQPSWADVEGFIRVKEVPGSAYTAPDTSYSLTPEPAQILITTYAPSLSQPQALTPGVATITVTTFAPSISIT